MKINLDKKKHFARLPVYVVIVYFLASIPITIYLARNSASFKQYQYAQENSNSTIPFGSIGDCSAIGNCPSSDPASSQSQSLIPKDSSSVVIPDNSSPVNPEIPKDSNPVNSEIPKDSSSLIPENSSSVVPADWSPDRKALFYGILEILEFLHPIIGDNNFNYAIDMLLKILGGGYTTVPPTTPPDDPGVPNDPAEVPDSPDVPNDPAEVPGVPNDPNNGTKVNVRVTFYTGWETGGKIDGGNPNGSPVAYPPYPRAGGTGTYVDPLTFAALATDRGGQYPEGTIIYVPSLQKYFVHEDKCEGKSPANPNGCSETQVDLYVGNPSDTRVAWNCAIAFTPNENTLTEIIINPPDNLPSDSPSILDQACPLNR